MCGLSMRALLLVVMSVCFSSCIKDGTWGGNEDKIFPGDRLPTFSVVMSDGTLMSDNELVGKVSIIVLFHTSCPDCRKELAILQQVYHNFRNNDEFVMIAVSREENEESVSRYWYDNELDIPFSAQEDRSVYELFSTKGVPRIYISDRNGVVHYVHSDMDMPSYDIIVEEIESLI